MNLTQVKKLKVGDQFRRPSSNNHDNGWRLYTVSAVVDKREIVCFDQHNYRVQLFLPNWEERGYKAFMKTAELCK